MDWQAIETAVDSGVGVITLNRPKTLNALGTQMMGEILTAMRTFDSDPEVRCILLRANGRAFAAGADISEMSSANPVSLLGDDRFSRWDEVQQIGTPIVVGVNGFCLGGGCELAMACDVIIAADDAQFGQPEVNLGIIPGAGGTQRLTRAVGKARAMDLVLTGRFIDATEALEAGLVSRVVTREALAEESMQVARTIASKGPVATRLAKECVNMAHTVPLNEGIAYERRAFYLLFATDDQKEGMAAFLEKRTPEFAGR